MVTNIIKQVPCASCGKPVRFEAAMQTKDGQSYHQGCPQPLPQIIQYTISVLEEMRHSLLRNHVSANIVNGAIVTTASNLCGNHFDAVLRALQVQP